MENIPIIKDVYVWVDCGKERTITYGQIKEIEGTYNGMIGKHFFGGFMVKPNTPIKDIPKQQPKEPIKETQKEHGKDQPKNLTVSDMIKKQNEEHNRKGKNYGDRENF
jgi:hypothetical protein